MVVFIYRRCFFFSSRRRHTISLCDWSSDVCSSDLLSRGGRDRPEDDAAGKLPAGGRGGVIGAGRAASARARRVTGGWNGRADGRSEERRVGKECGTRGVWS